MFLLFQAIEGGYFGALFLQKTFLIFSKKSLTFVEISVKINIVAREERLKMRI